MIWSKGTPRPTILLAEDNELNRDMLRRSMENEGGAFVPAGADDFISKPFDPASLRAHLGACLEKKLLRNRERPFRAEIQTEHEESDRLLLNVLPRSVAERLKQGETMTSSTSNSPPAPCAGREV